MQEFSAMQAAMAKIPATGKNPPSWLRCLYWRSINVATATSPITRAADHSGTMLLCTLIKGDANREAGCHLTTGTILELHGFVVGSKFQAVRSSNIAECLILLLWQLSIWLLQLRSLKIKTENTHEAKIRQRYFFPLRALCNALEFHSKFSCMQNQLPMS